MQKVLSIAKGRILELILILLALVPVLGILPSYQFYILERGLQNSVTVMSLVILLGLTGALSLGHAGLVAVGAYTYGLLNTMLGINPWICLIIAPFVVAGIGVILGFPSFKLSGPFLVVTTIAFGEIVRLLILNFDTFTGGPFGLKGIKPLVDGSNLMFWFLIIVAYLVAVAVKRLAKSRLGLAFQAIREDAVAAEVMGVNVRGTKLLSFTISAFLAGLSGVLIASLMGYINPDSFTFSESSTYLLMVVMGGMTNITGAVVSSLVVTALPEVLRFLSTSRLFIYGLLLLLVLRYYDRITVLFTTKLSGSSKKQVPQGIAKGGEK